MPPHVIFTRHADSPLRVIVPPAPVKYWDCTMTLRVPGVGKAPALRVFQLTFWASGAVVPRKNTRSTAPMGTPPMVMASPYDPLPDVCVDSMTLTETSM